MGIKTAKFGGTSLCGSEQFRKVRAIVEADPERRYVIPSAPGKRCLSDSKVTDLLYICHAMIQQSLPFQDVFAVIGQRFREIAEQLGLTIDVQSFLDRIAGDMQAGASLAYVASRGEYLSGRILADYLGCEFIDAAEIIKFNDRGFLDFDGTQAVMHQRLAKTSQAVIPGFYGAMPDGTIQTFSRGGSDITGALVARAAEASVYENWTDVSGFLMADPRLVHRPRHINVITYKELRELAYMGANVLHEDSIYPVRLAGIPVNIRNTNDPQHPGTLIVQKTDAEVLPGAITGIAGRKDFTIISIEKALMHYELGFVRRLLSILENHGISFEHLPSGIDHVSLVILDEQLNGKLDSVIEDVWSQVHPDSVEVVQDIALISTVGVGMAYTPGIAARLFGALAESGINIRMIDQGASEINIIVGVQEDDFERAIRTIYKAFVF